MFRILYSNPNKNNIIERYRETLTLEGITNATIKNYLTDVKQFMVWRESKPSASKKEAISLFSEDMSRLFSKSSVRRKNSSIKKFIAFENINKRDEKGRGDKNYPLWLTGFAVFIVFAFVSSPKENLELVKNISTNIENVAIPKEVAIGNPAQVSSFDKFKNIKVSLPPHEKSVVSSSSLLEEFRDKPLISEGLNMTGKAAISAGQTEVLVFSEGVSQLSYISLTPQSATGGQVLYVKSQNDGYFTIAIDKAITSDIDFQWKLDNIKIYHSEF